MNDECVYMYVYALYILSKVDKFDDPNTSANKLVLALRNLNINLDFPVAKLKQPYGEVRGVIMYDRGSLVTTHACGPILLLYPYRLYVLF